MKAEHELFLSDAHGQYIPKVFAECVLREKVTGISDEDYTILETGPDHEWYWETWDDVLNRAVLTGDDGTKYTLYQDGDLWLIPDGFTDEQWEEYFGY
jgi:hypothetical protein